MPITNNENNTISVSDVVEAIPNWLGKVVCTYTQRITIFYVKHWALVNIDKTVYPFPVESLKLVKKFKWLSLVPKRPGYYWILCDRWRIVKVARINGDLCTAKYCQQVKTIHPTRWGGEFK